MLDNVTQEFGAAGNASAMLDEFEALRGKIREASRQDGLSFAAIAKLAGIGQSTVPAWMKKSYSGNYTAVAEKLRAWLETRESERQTRSVLLRKPDFVATPSAMTFLHVLSHAQSLGRMAVIAGGAGIGKTTALKKYQGEHSNVWRITCAPKNATAAQIMEDICDRLGLSDMAGTKRFRAICARLTGRQALLIVDEAQHLKMNGIEQLRAIADETEIGIVLAGNIDVNRRVDGGGRQAEFAQVFSRLGMRVEVVNSTAGDITAMLDAFGVRDDKVRTLLGTIARKPGGLRQMVYTLDAAMLAAAGEALTDKHVVRAANILEGQQ